MRIAIIAPLVAPIREPQRGGSQAFVADLARGLIGRRHEIHLYAASGSDVPGVRVIDTGVDHRSLSATLYRASGAADRPSARDRRARSPASTPLCARTNTTSSTTTPSTHPRSGSPPDWALRWSTRSTYPRTTRSPRALRHAAETDAPPTVAGVSEFQASAWRRVVPIDAILPPYVPTSLIGWLPGAGDGAVFAGRLSPEKGAAEAIDIARTAGVRIDVYGDSYDAEYVRAWIDPLRAEPGVGVQPAVPRASLWEAMARAAVVLCPAKWDEPFGMVAAEAQACGTPVVAFDRGALGEVIVDERDRVPGRSRRHRRRSRCRRAGRRDCRVRNAARMPNAGWISERSLEAHERLYRGVVGAGSGAAVHG